MNKELTIQLDTNVSMFTMAIHPGFQYLGRIQRGLEVGALAVTPQGVYVQVNGSIVTPLNASRITAQLRKLQGRRGGPIPGLRAPSDAASDTVSSAEDEAGTYTAQQAPAVPVTVVIRKKKRTLVMP